MKTELFSKEISNWDGWAAVFQSIDDFLPLIEEIRRRESLPEGAIEHGAVRKMKRCDAFAAFGKRLLHAELPRLPVGLPAERDQIAAQIQQCGEDSVFPEYARRFIGRVPFCNSAEIDRLSLVAEHRCSGRFIQNQIAEIDHAACRAALFLRGEHMFLLCGAPKPRQRRRGDIKHAVAPLRPLGRALQKKKRISADRNRMNPRAAIQLRNLAFRAEN